MVLSVLERPVDKILLPTDVLELLDKVLPVYTLALFA